MPETASRTLDTSLFMKLVILHGKKDTTIGSGENLLRLALSDEPTASVIFAGLKKGLPHSCNRVPIVGCLKLRHSNAVYVLPKEWGVKIRPGGPRIITYKDKVPIYAEFISQAKRTGWFVVCDGRFATQISNVLLEQVLSGANGNVVAVDVTPELLAYREKVRLTTKNKVVGFRRLHSDSIEPASAIADWPHYLFIKSGALDLVLTDQVLSMDFYAFAERCRSKQLVIHSFKVAGTVLDLQTEGGLLDFYKAFLDSASIRGVQSTVEGVGAIIVTSNHGISRGSRIIRKVLLGRNVQIGEQATIVGPTIIADNVKIGQGATIYSSIIGSNITVGANQFVNNRVLQDMGFDGKHVLRSNGDGAKQIGYAMRRTSSWVRIGNAFRTWPKFSYPRFFKRFADCLTAIIVLILFAPVMPFIALAVKMSSTGPLFFKDRRQGFHGRKFNCFKFRTMTVGADKIQEKLRVVSEVDGPQFKMADDPRINVIGRFLRETHIDEIPQFINVLLGQMSVVGPRPSPEQENTLCPFWHDARLSVRPGITGLWQVCRTRQPLKDFQEWIHYDTRYVRELSPRMDLWICRQTVKKLIDNFINQF